MPIAVQTIIDRVASSLDAEGSGYYTFDRDYKPAINATIDWLIAVVNFAYGDKKISEEIFQEITYTRIFQASAYNRIFFDSVVLGHSVWTLFGVYPSPIVKPTNAVPTILAPPEDSLYEPLVAYISSEYSATRLTAEEWNINVNNPFKAGNNIYAPCADLKSYAYRNYSNYEAGASYNVTVPREIEIRPSVANEFVGIEYAARPAEITLITNNISFPVSLIGLFYEKTLNYIARKQGDNTTIAGVTNADIQLLLKALL